MLMTALLVQFSQVALTKELWKAPYFLPCYILSAVGLYLKEKGDALSLLSH